MIAALADFNPKLLSRQQKRAIALLDARKVLNRSSGGYGHSPDKVTLDVANSLIALGLARVDRTGRNPRLDLTGSGRLVASVSLQGRRA